MRSFVFGIKLRFQVYFVFLVLVQLLTQPRDALPNVGEIERKEGKRERNKLLVCSPVALQLRAPPPK